MPEKKSAPKTVVGLRLDPAVKRVLRRIAKQEGKSLSEFLAARLERIAAQEGQAA